MTKKSTKYRRLELLERTSSKEVSTALCMAVPSVLSTDNMASKMTWPVPWAAVGGHMSMPAGCLTAKKYQKRRQCSSLNHTSSIAKECV